MTNFYCMSYRPSFASRGHKAATLDRIRATSCPCWTPGGTYMLCHYKQTCLWDTYRNSFLQTGMSVLVPFPYKTKSRFKTLDIFKAVRQVATLKNPRTESLLKISALWRNLQTRKMCVFWDMSYYWDRNHMYLLCQQRTAWESFIQTPLRGNDMKSP